MPAAVARAKSAKTKLMNGKVVSSRSKTGSSECSAAMSEWVTTRKSGSTPASVFAILGQCRAKARALKQASQHKAAGNEAKAQRLEAIAAGKKGPVTAKDRMALAKEKRATLNAKRAANPIAAAMQGGGASAGGASAPVKAEGRGTAERMARANAIRNSLRSGQSHAGGAGPTGDRAYRVGMARAERSRNMTPREASVNAPAPTSEPWVHTGSRKSPGTGAEIYGEAGPQPQIKAPVARFTAARLERAKTLRAERAAKNSPSVAMPQAKPTKTKAPRKTAAAPAAKPGAKPKPVKGTITINDRRSETGKSQVEGFIHGAFAAHPNIAGLKSWTVTQIGRAHV